jgi:hypothetical protein
MPTPTPEPPPASAPGFAPPQPPRLDPAAFRPLRIDEDYDVVDDSPGLDPIGPPSPRPRFDPSSSSPAAVRAEAAPQYPIPPAFAEDPDDAPSGPVPTWGFRAPSPTPGVAGTAFADLTLDPMSLRRRATIRSGAAALSVDDTRLVLRSWWKRTEIPWSEIRGFEPRFEGTSASGSSGRLVAITDNGPQELPATKRSLADLRYLAALLDAYRQRALLIAHR